MKQKISVNTVAFDVAAGKMEYVKPEIEVIDLAEEPKLLSSSVGTSFKGVGREDWDEE